MLAVAKLLVGPPMPDWSMTKTQTNEAIQLVFQDCRGLDGKNIVTKSKEAMAGLSEGQLTGASEEGLG